MKGQGRSEPGVRNASTPAARITASPQRGPSLSARISLSGCLSLPQSCWPPAEPERIFLLNTFSHNSIFWFSSLQKHRNSWNNLQDKTSQALLVHQHNWGQEGSFPSQRGWLFSLCTLGFILFLLGLAGVFSRDTACSQFSSLIPAQNCNSSLALPSCAVRLGNVQRMCFRAKARRYCACRELSLTLIVQSLLGPLAWVCCFLLTA